MSGYIKIEANKEVINLLDAVKMFFSCPADGLVTTAFITPLAKHYLDLIGVLHVDNVLIQDD